MRATRVALTLVLTLALAGITDLAAQRRGTGGGSSSGGRQEPRSGGSGSSGGERRGSGSSSGGQRGSTAGGATRRGGEERAEPRRGEGSETRERGSDDANTSARGSRNTGTRSSDGRIAAVRDRARAARITTSRGVRVVGGYWIGGCFDCTPYWGWYNNYWGWYHGGWWYPAYYPRYHRPHDHSVEAEEVPEGEAQPGFGQTYLEYPYAGGTLTGSTFVQQDAPGRRGYGALSVQYFGDDVSAVEAGRFTLEGSSRLFHGELQYAHYAEPVTGGVDRMHVWRAAGGVQAPVGARANIVAAVALRGINLDTGEDAYGPEAELGLQLLPVRPIGINLNGRAAAMTWTGRDQFAYRELNATGSVFLGRVELQAGWHYMKIGATPAFSGPVAGLRMWF